MSIIIAWGSGRPASTSSSRALIEAGGVAAMLVDNRQDLVDVFEQRRREERFAGSHPVQVAAQGVDLAVVRKHAVGVRQLPARERVRAEARMEHRQRADHARVAQVREVLAQLRRREHALIDERPAGKAGEVEPFGVPDAPAVDRLLEALADDVEPALEVVLGGNVARPGRRTPARSMVRRASADCRREKRCPSGPRASREDAGLLLQRWP